MKMGKKQGNATKGAKQFSGKTAHGFGAAGSNIPKKSKGNGSTGVSQFSGSRTAAT